MNCPYCGCTVKKVVTGNGSVGVNELYVSEDNDAFDVDISFFQCEVDSGHVFYADDKMGNSVEDLEKFIL